MLAETTDNTNCHCHTLLWKLCHWFRLFELGSVSDEAEQK